MKKNNAPRSFNSV